MKKCREQVKAAGIGSNLSSGILMVVRDETIYVKSKKRV